MRSLSLREREDVQALRRSPGSRSRRTPLLHRLILNDKWLSQRSSIIARLSSIEFGVLATANRRSDPRALHSTHGRLRLSRLAGGPRRTMGSHRRALQAAPLRVSALPTAQRGFRPSEPAATGEGEGCRTRRWPTTMPSGTWSSSAGCVSLSKVTCVLLECVQQRLDSFSAMPHGISISLGYA